MMDQLTPGTVTVQQQQSPHGGGTITTIAGGVFDAFKTSPILLLIVILNMAFAGAGAYYLIQIEAYRAADRQSLTAMVDKCIGQSVPLEYLTRLPPPYAPYREPERPHQEPEK